VIVILLGLHIMGVWKIGLLYREKRFTENKPHKGLVGAYITGLAFAFAWTPCIGPILGAILTFSATQETVSRGVLLLSIYSLGLGVPFLLAALGMQSFLTLFVRIKGSLRAIEVAAGLLIVVMGTLMLTNNLTWLSGQLAFLNQFVW
jgi:cytochrome c-type biogenesis protein